MKTLLTIYKGDDSGDIIITVGKWDLRFQPSFWRCKFLRFTIYRTDPQPNTKGLHLHVGPFSITSQFPP